MLLTQTCFFPPGYFHKFLFRSVSRRIAENTRVALFCIDVVTILFMAISFNSKEQHFICFFWVLQYFLLLNDTFFTFHCRNNSIGKITALSSHQISPQLGSLSDANSNRFAHKRVVAIFFGKNCHTLSYVHTWESIDSLPLNQLGLHEDLDKQAGPRPRPLLARPKRALDREQQQHQQHKFTYTYAAAAAACRNSYSVRNTLELVVVE